MGLNFETMMQTGVAGMFYVLLLFFTINSILLAYHWYKYGSSNRISTIALATYLSGGAILFLTLTIALNTL